MPSMGANQGSSTKPAVWNFGLSCNGLADSAGDGIKLIVPQDRHVAIAVQRFVLLGDFVLSGDNVHFRPLLSQVQGGSVPLIENEMSNRFADRYDLGHGSKTWLKSKAPRERAVRRESEEVKDKACTEKN